MICASSLSIITALSQRVIPIAKHKIPIRTHIHRKIENVMVGIMPVIERMIPRTVIKMIVITYSGPTPKIGR